MGFLLYPKYWWLPLGAAALFLALLCLLRAVAGQRRGQAVMRFASFACALGSMLSMFYLTLGWVEAGDWAALEDCVPGMAKILTAAVAVGLGLHLLAILPEFRREKERGGT